MLTGGDSRWSSGGERVVAELGQDVAGLAGSPGGQASSSARHSSTGAWRDPAFGQTALGQQLPQVPGIGPVPAPPRHTNRELDL
jgi:hypothetical protein